VNSDIYRSYTSWSPAKRIKNWWLNTFSIYICEEIKKKKNCKKLVLPRASKETLSYMNKTEPLDSPLSEHRKLTNTDARALKGQLNELINRKHSLTNRESKYIKNSILCPDVAPHHVTSGKKTRAFMKRTEINHGVSFSLLSHVL
jgi:hypothetical protein